jgi:cellulose synthase/poly-beta-1,6-N-acetylglucosamine synthase-like glycosyltransferase
MVNEKNSLKIVVILISFIIVLPIIAITLLLTYIFLIALIPTALSFAYLLIELKKQQSNKYSKYGNNKRLQLPFIVFGLWIIPLIIQIVIVISYSFDVYSIIISFGMSLTFITTCFYLPLSIYQKYFQKTAKASSLLMPSLTVIVPAYNEEKTVGRTIDSLIESDYSNKEVIIVDDGSIDQTYAVASKYKRKFPNGRFSVIRKQNGGKSSAINYALCFAKGEIIIVIDSDSIIEKAALKEIIKNFENPAVAAVAGYVKVLKPSNILTKCAALEVLIAFNIIGRAFSLFGSVIIIPGALGAFRKKTIAKTGMYDKDTLTEDFDLTVKLLKSGAMTKMDSSSVTYTECPTSLKELYKQRTRWNRGNFQTLIKHKNIMTNARYGILHKFAYPITLIMFLTRPFATALVTAFIIVAILDGRWISIIVPFTVFLSLQYLISAIAIIMDGKENWKILLYSPLMVMGYQQLLDFVGIKSILDVLLRKNLKWTGVKRVRIIDKF